MEKHYNKINISLLLFGTILLLSSVILLYIVNADYKYTLPLMFISFAILIISSPNLKKSLKITAGILLFIMALIDITKLLL